MSSLVTEQRGVVLPGRRRRLALFATFALMGGSAAYLMPSAVAWEQAAAGVTLLAVVAGLSALWSP